MTKLIETLNNTVKLISSLATLAVLGGIVYCGLSAYRWTSDTLSKPIQLPSIKLPDVQLPKVKIEAPEIKLKAPTIDFSGLFGGKAEEPEEPYDPANPWAFKPRKGEAPPPAAKGCQHIPKCPDKYYHIIENHHFGNTGGEWVEPEPPQPSRLTAEEIAAMARTAPDSFLAMKHCPHTPKCADEKEHWQKWVKDSPIVQRYGATP